MYRTPAFDILRREPQQILVGHDVTTGAAASLSLDALKTTSTHVIGASSYGKSYFLRGLLGAFVKLRQPCGIIDPHGDTARWTLAALRRAGVPAHRIVVLDPGDDRYALSFDPLRCVPDPSAASSLVLDAFAKAWGGGQSLDATPRMEGLLRGLFRLLIDGGLTLVEGFDVLNVDAVGLRRALRERVGDRIVRQDFEEYEKLPRAEKLAVTESTRNRLRRFVHAAPLRAMLGQTGNPLDMQAVLDGKFLICDLSSIAAPEIQRLVGALVVNAVYHAARRRDPHRPRHWFLVCDEFGEFATADFANSLDALRKFGVSTVLAHQRLRQLERENPDVLSAVLTNAKIRVVFGGLERPEAERMSRELYTGAVNGERVKHVAMATKFRPIDDVFTVETETGAESDSESASWGASSGSSSGVADGDSIGYRGDDGETNLDALHHGRVSSRHESSNRSESAGGGRSVSTSQGWSRSVVPVTRHEEFREASSTQFFGLDEEWERRIGTTHGLGRREALMRVANGPVVHLRTANVPPETNDARAARFHVAVMEACPNVAPADAVRAQIEGRRLKVAAMADGAGGAPPVNVRSFRE